MVGWTLSISSCLQNLSDVPMVVRERLNLRPASSPMDRKCFTRLLTTLLLIISAWWSVKAQEVGLPSAPNSAKFAAIGDAGSGAPEPYDVANQMTRFHAKFPFDRVIILVTTTSAEQDPPDPVQKFP